MFLASVQKADFFQRKMFRKRNDKDETICWVEATLTLGEVKVMEA